MSSSYSRSRRGGPPGVAAALAVLAALVVALAVSGCSSPSSAKPPAIRVVLGATTFPASTPLYVAQERGYFQREGLDVEFKIYDAGAQALEDTIEGRLDFSAVAETPVARAVLDGRSFDVIATVAEIDSANYIVARRDHGVARAADLKGKRLGLIPSTSADYFQQVYLTTQRLDPKTVTRVALTPQTLLAALASGTVDAIAGWPPFTTDAESLLGTRAVVLDEPGLYLMSWNIATPRRGGPSTEAKERFLRAMVAADEYIRSNPEESRAIASRRTGVAKADLDKMWSGTHWTVTLDQSLILALEDEARWMISVSGQPRSTPDFLSVLDAGPLQSVSPQDVDIILPGG